MKKIAVFCSANADIDSVYFEKVTELGEWMGKNDMTLVYGGCNMGLMDCIAKAVHSCGGRVIGIIPTIIEKNGHTSDFNDVEIPCQNLSDRKDLMLAQSDMIIALPGGIGTLDEIFTVAAAATIGYHNKQIILYNINGFWDSLLTVLKEMEERKFIRGTVSQHILTANTFEEIKKLILK